MKKGIILVLDKYLLIGAFLVLGNIFLLINVILHLSERNLFLALGGNIISLIMSKLISSVYKEKLKKLEMEWHELKEDLEKGGR